MSIPPIKTLPQPRAQSVTNEKTVAQIRGSSVWCRGRDSNPHGLNTQGILSPSRLPIPPPRLLSIYRPYYRQNRGLFRISPTLHDKHQAQRKATGGFEPPHRGFADPRLNHLATSPSPPAPINRGGKQILWSGRRDSNSRPSPWQGDALPAELLPLLAN